MTGPAYHSHMVSNTDILFYDGNCPICLREIQILDRWKDQGLKLVDIHAPEMRSHAGNFTSNELLSVLHLKAAENIWLKGLDATERAWRHTPFGWLFAPLRWPYIQIVADYVYYRWAGRRACRLGYSSSCQQTHQPSPG